MLKVQLEELKKVFKESNDEETKEIIDIIPQGLRSLLFKKGCELLSFDLTQNETYKESYCDSLHDNLDKTMEEINKIKKYKTSVCLKSTNRKDLSLKILYKGTLRL